MKKLLSLILAIVTLGSSFVQAQLVPNPCNPENSSNPDCLISMYQAIYCPDPCQPLLDASRLAGIAALGACRLAPGSPACVAAGTAAAAAATAAGLCEAANAVSYAAAVALCELGL